MSGTLIIILYIQISAIEFICEIEVLKSIYEGKIKYKKSPIQIPINSNTKLHSIRKQTKIARTVGRKKRTEFIFDGDGEEYPRKNRSILDMHMDWQADDAHSRA